MILETGHWGAGRRQVLPVCRGSQLVSPDTLDRSSFPTPTLTLGLLICEMGRNIFHWVPFPTHTSFLKTGHSEERKRQASAPTAMGVAEVGA